MAQGLNAHPDGYTLAVVTREVVSLPLQGQAPFETLDFKYIACLNIDPAVLVVSADSPYTTLEDFLAALKASPIL